MLAARSPGGAPAQAASALLQLAPSEFTLCHARSASASPDGGKAIDYKEKREEDVAPLRQSDCKFAFNFANRAMITVSYI